MIREILRGAGQWNTDAARGVDTVRNNDTNLAHRGMESAPSPVQPLSSAELSEWQSHLETQVSQAKSLLDDVMQELSTVRLADRLDASARTSEPGREEAKRPGGLEHEKVFVPRDSDLTCVARGGARASAHGEVHLRLILVDPRDGPFLAPPATRPGNGCRCRTTKRSSTWRSRF